MKANRCVWLCVGGALWLGCGDAYKPPNNTVIIDENNQMGPPAGSEDVAVGFPSGPLLEGGSPVTVTVALKRPPSATVRIDVFSSNEAAGTVSPASLTFNVTGTVATVTFSGFLPDGNYKATLLASGVGGGITDLSGNRLAANRVDDFFFLQGDINHDREVGAGDFNLLATNFGLGGRTFAQGDLDLDGVVGPGDFNILATKFGTILAP